MCLAVPMKIVEIAGNRAVVDMGGARATVGLDLLEGAAVGDYVIVHAGFAIEKLNPDEARKTLELLADLEEGSGGR